MLNQVQSRLRWFLLFVAAFSVSCASAPLIGSLSPQAARRAARRDIVGDRMRIYMAGTIASSEVGIEPADHELVARLPHDHGLPQGCTTPDAPEAVNFARAYNLEIVRYLRTHPTAKPKATSEGSAETRLPPAVHFELSLPTVEPGMASRPIPQSRPRLA